MDEAIKFFAKMAGHFIEWLGGKTSNLEEDIEEIRDFIVDAAEYAYDHIDDAVWKAMSEAMAAAESDFMKDPSLDRAVFATGNAASSLDASGVSFLISDLNYARETMIQQRNKRMAALEAPAPQPEAPAATPGDDTSPSTEPSDTE